MEATRLVQRLRELQGLIRSAVMAARRAGERKRLDLAAVTRVSAADTIYAIDAEIEPVIEDYCEHWGRETPLVLVAEGIEPESGRVFPAGKSEAEAGLRVLIDPIDGTRGLMYDKRSAWSLGAVAPNKGAATRLGDVVAAVMTELPTSKMGWGDVLWATKGGGARGLREQLWGEAVADRQAATSEPAERSDPALASGASEAGASRVGREEALVLRPSTQTQLSHGFAAVANFFPGTKVLAAELAEAVMRAGTEGQKSVVFDDQYICTGGQFYELIMGHDRFLIDARPYFYRALGHPEGLCVHPYDCAAKLIAEEAGVLLTDGLGGALDAPFDTVSPVAWAGYANATLRDRLEPVIREFFRQRGVAAAR